MLLAVSWVLLNSGDEILTHYLFLGSLDFAHFKNSKIFQRSNYMEVKMCIKSFFNVLGSVNTLHAPSHLIHLSTKHQYLFFTAKDSSIRLMCPTLKWDWFLGPYDYKVHSANRYMFTIIFLELSWNIFPK